MACHVSRAKPQVRQALGRQASQLPSARNGVVARSNMPSIFDSQTTTTPETSARSTIDSTDCPDERPFHAYLIPLADPSNAIQHSEQAVHSNTTNIRLPILDAIPRHLKDEHCPYLPVRLRQQAISAVALQIPSLVVGFPFANIHSSVAIPNIFYITVHNADYAVN
jgi:hypothetical protein